MPERPIRGGTKTRVRVSVALLAAALAGCAVTPPPPPPATHPASPDAASAPARPIAHPLSDDPATRRTEALLKRGEMPSSPRQ